MCSETSILFLNHSNTINPYKDLHFNTKGSGKLRQIIINFITKDFFILNDVTKTEPILDKNSIGKSSYK